MPNRDPKQHSETVNKTADCDTNFVNFEWLFVGVAREGVRTRRWMSYHLPVAKIQDIRPTYQATTYMKECHAQLGI
jgi:hypothetical protein